MQRSKMKYLALVFVALSSQHAFSWGAQGHRIVGDIAQHLVKRSTARELKKLLGSQDLAEVATWADDIRSYPDRNYVIPWHFASVADGGTYAASTQDPAGDVVTATKKAVETLKSSKASQQDKAEAVKFLVHFIGDMHQPLHVGRVEDRGGNSIKVKLFDEDSNLHKVWDEGLIDSEKLSYTEWSTLLRRRLEGQDSQTQQWKNSSIEDWAQESINVRAQVYDFGRQGEGLPKLSYEYRLKNRPLLERRLLQAGVRLAAILDATL
jgi:hypothetical protein